MDETPERRYEMNTGDWGALPNEPCRFCRQVGGVQFLIKDGLSHDNQQEVRCDKCKRAWVADSSSA